MLKINPFKAFLCLFITSSLFSLSVRADSTLVKFGSTWKYLDIGSAAPTGAGAADWRNAAFNDASWASGLAEMGYGETDERTVVSYGGNAASKYPTTYFRKLLNIPSLASYGAFRINGYIDDGMVVYVNGTEVARYNMPGGAIAYSTYASAATADDGRSIVSIDITTTGFVSGSNCIAVEVHQNSASSSDLSFDLELIGRPGGSTTFFDYGSSWKYLDNGSNQGTGWRAIGYNDASWASGNGELGYGDGDEATVVSYGGNTSNRYITTYFRKTVNVDPSLYGSFSGFIKRDDGCVIYVNGTEVYRSNLSGTVSYTTLASLADDDGDSPQAFSIPTSAFVNGNNQIAVEIHQNSASSSDISFDMTLQGDPVGVEPNIIRGPLLQMVSENAITIRWTTTAPSSSRIVFGTNDAALNDQVTDNTLVTEHELRISGLTADTKYFYGIGSVNSICKASYRNYFITAPPENTTRKIRIGVFGDAGTGNANQKGTRDGYLDLKKASNNSELALMLGDNAYNSGTEGEHQTNFFDIYNGNVFDNHTVFSVPGNHEYANSGSRANDHNIPYFDVFTLPTAAESGGIASGTEHYYSFDYGNIHFVMLDSYGYDGGKLLYDSTGQQATWLKADLAANTRKWTIVSLHHPPYTNGTHFSNSESDLIAIRQQITPILERFGVDVVLAGHSHVYERTFLIKNHTGNSSSFVAGTNQVSSSSARYDGSANSCPYFSVGGKTDHGTVYVVAGSAGQIGGGTNAQYPAFYYRNYSGTANGEVGVLYLEIEDNRLDAKFVGISGNLRDQFTIMKDVNRNNTVNMVVNTTQNLNASWVGGYAWYTAPAPPFVVSGTNRSLSVTPSSTGTYTYYVVDSISPNNTCLADTFTLQVSASLAVSLSKFEAIQKNESSLLKWTTEFEQDNHYFTIEKSTDGRNFSFLMLINGAGNSTTPVNYEFSDNNPGEGTNYYRLLQTDLNGKTTNLGIRTVHFKTNRSFRINIQPNPAINNQVQLNISSQKKQDASIQVFNMGGAKVYERTQALGSGDNKIGIPLRSGSYVISVQTADGGKITDRLIVK